MALFSLRRSDRELLSRSEHKRDQVVLQLIKNPRRLLTTVLIGNESVNVAVSTVTAGLIDRSYAGHSQVEAALLATAVALPLLLFLGEITPKSIAMGISLQWSRRAARVLWAFSVLILPLRLVVRAVADTVLRFMGATRPKVAQDISEEEFMVLVDAGSADGEVDDRERRIIHRVFEFGDKTVAQAMQRRGKVFALAYELPIARLVKEVAARGYSRVPIYDRTLDNIRGILYAKDLVQVSSGAVTPRRLSDMLHEPFFVPHTTSIERLFGIFKQGRTHMALVVNEYGTLVGIVTMEDLLEELFGEIHDERELQKSMAASLRQPTEPSVVTTEGA